MARLTPPHPHSPHPIPPDPTSFPRTRESSEKQSTPFTPLRKAKGDASAASRGMPEIHRNTPNHNNPPSPFTQPVGAVREPPLPPPNPPPSQKSPNNQQRVPSPASHSPPPPRGRLRGGPRVRARSAADHHPNHTQHRQRLGQKGAGHHSPSANISVIRGSDTHPPIHRNTPSHNNVSPLPRAIPLPLPGGD